MARVPIIKPPHFRVPIVDPKTGLATADFARYQEDLYRRVGQAVGDLPTNLVTDTALNAAAVTEAKIDDLAVTNPKLNTDAVSTVKVLDNAITIPGATTTAGGISFHTASFVEIQSITITPSGNNAVFVFFNMTINVDNLPGSAQRLIQFRISRDATILYPTSVLQTVETGIVYQESKTVSTVDLTPPNSSSIYKLEIRIDSTTGVDSATATERTALVLEARK